MNELILVTGAGGFIGGHLVGRLLQEGQRVRAVDSKAVSHWYQRFPDAENLTLNLEEKKTVSPPPKVAIRCTIWPPTWAGWDL
jgi:nucleoside-diphosphate-sugar epimerase